MFPEQPSKLLRPQVYDLLDPYSTQNCTVRESNEKGVYVEGLMEQAVTSATDAYQVRFMNLN